MEFIVDFNRSGFELVIDDISIKELCTADAINMPISIRRYGSTICTIRLIGFEDDYEKYLSGFIMSADKHTTIGEMELLLECVNGFELFGLRIKNISHII